VDTLHRRLVKLEVSAREEVRQRFHAAVLQLRASLNREQARTISQWIREHVIGRDIMTADCEAGHGVDRFCLRCIEAANPPAMVRAAWVLVFEHIEHGTSAALPPEVAQVYVDHPNARPEFACSGCGYLLPGHGSRAAYAGPCPGCRPGSLEDR
jgi:hypothetical protein